MPGWGVIPSIRVSDMANALSFYTDILGFTVRRAEPDGDNASLNLGDANIMLERPASYYSEPFNAAIRARMGAHGPNSLYIESEDVAALSARVAAAGATVVDPLAERPWGQSEFTVEDPWGNWLTFWQALGVAATG